MGIVMCLLLPACAHGFAVHLFKPRLYAGESVHAVVPRGPGGDTWLTTTLGRIVRVTPHGDVTEFGHGLTDGGAQDLVPGNDGALWFAEAGVGQKEAVIGRIDSAGHITEYPSGLPQIDSLVRGPDGALWYDGCVNESSCGQELDRMDTHGHVQRFPVSGSSLSNLTAAHDGKLWSAIQPMPPSTAGAMAKISLHGTITRFPLPDGIPSPRSGLVPGPGGGVWFIADIQSNVAPFSETSRPGYIDDAGHVTMLAGRRVRSPGTPVAQGPSGSMWEDDDGFRLLSPTGTQLAHNDVLYVPSLAVVGPDHSLWGGSTEVLHTDRLAAGCVVPNVKGSLARFFDLDFGYGPYALLAPVGCRYRIRHKPSGDQSLIVKRQEPAPGTEISANTPVELTVGFGPTHYGRCRAPIGDVALERTKAAVIWRPIQRSNGAETYFACLLRTGKRRVLTATPRGRYDRSFDLHVAGDWVAFATLDQSQSDEACLITRVDLATGTALKLMRRRYSYREGPACPDRLAVSRTGLLAWDLLKWSHPASEPAGHATLEAHDATGTHVVATTEPLDLGSFGFTANTLRWTDNNVARATALTASRP
jgi:virginiamycin B lyase